MSLFAVFSAPFTRARRRRSSLGAALLAIALAACRPAATRTTPDDASALPAATGAPPATVPAAIAVAAPLRVLLQVFARGVQIYQCDASNVSAPPYKWNLAGPDATLFDEKGALVGKHYAGPTWEALDGSKVTGVVIARSNGPDSNAIPWLLLRAGTTSGSGIFSDVKSIQRLNTIGGSAPAGGCGQSQVGQEQRVPYSADYLFYA
jgi:hypothetical protein